MNIWHLVAAGGITILGLATCWALVRINRINNEEEARRQEESDMLDLRLDVARRRASLCVLRGGKS